MTAADKRNLQAKKEVLIEEIEQQKIMLRALQSALSRNETAVINLDEELSKYKMTKKEENSMEITDHAFTRYLERVMEFPVDDLKKKMKEEIMSYSAAGICKIPLKGKFQAICRDGVVLTIY